MDPPPERVLELGQSLSLMKKSLYSLPALREAPRTANRRYLEFLSTLADPRAGVGKLHKLSESVIEHDRSYRGFNLFAREDQQLLEVLARGEFNIRGLQNRTLRDHLPEKSCGQDSIPASRATRPFLRMQRAD